MGLLFRSLPVKDNIMTTVVDLWDLEMFERRNTCWSGLGAAAGVEAGEGGEGSSLKTLGSSTATMLTGSDVAKVGMEGIIELCSSRPKPAAGEGAAARSPTPPRFGELLETLSITGLSLPPPFGLMSI